METRPKQFLAVVDVAALARVTPRTILNYYRRGLLHHADPSRRKPLLFREREVTELLPRLLSRRWRLRHGFRRGPAKRQLGGVL